MKIQLETDLAKGGSSSVKFARDMVTMKPVAAKVILLDDDVGRRTFKHESALMAKVPDHRNLPKLLGVSKGITSSGSPVGYIVLEYLPFPTLSEFIKRRGPFPDDEARFIVRQLIDVVEMLALSGLAHRDLKPDNMMINPDNYIIKLIDFGLGMTIRHGVDSVDNSYRGTPIYMAPEVLSKSTAYNIVKAELYSIGTIGVELCTGKQPYEQIETAEEILKAQIVGPDLSSLSAEAQRVLGSLLEYNPASRPNLAQAKQLTETLTDFDPAAVKRFWATSRALTFENLRSFSDITAKARTGTTGSVHHRIIKKEQPLTERELIEESRRCSETPSPTPKIVL